MENDTDEKTASRVETDTEFRKPSPKFMNCSLKERQMEVVGKRKSQRFEINCGKS